jgi:hypothetical protein
MFPEKVAALLFFHTVCFFLSGGGIFSAPPIQAGLKPCFGQLYNFLASVFKSPAASTCVLIEANTM